MMKELRLLYSENDYPTSNQAIHSLGYRVVETENSWHNQVLLDRIQTEIENSIGSKKRYRVLLIEE